jgi:PAS domain S-box-containing protein
MNNLSGIVEEVDPSLTFEGTDQLDYRLLVEQLPGAVYRARPGAKGEWLYVSPNVQRITGVAASVFASDPTLWFSLIHPDDRDAVLLLEDSVTIAGEAYVAEYRMVRPDGSIVWVNDESMSMLDRDGALVLQGVLLDITDRKSVEFEMELSVSLLQATLEATADGILVIDPNGKILGFNKRFLEMWRIPDELAEAGDDASLLGHVIDQLAHPQTFLRRVQELYADPGAEDFAMVEFKDGRLFERYSIPRQLGDRNIGRVWSFRDRTEHCNAAEQLRVSEGRLRSIVESEPECVKLIDRNGVLLEMNPAGLRMIEADDLSSVTGECIYDLIVDEDKEAFLNLNRRIFDGERGSLTFDLIGLKGGRRTIETTAVPFRDATGEVVGHLAVARDVSERQLLEEKLRQSQKLEALGRLAGGVAHDFNNVLTVIANYASFINDGLSHNDQFRGDANEIMRASDRGASLVKQLLAFSRKEVVQLRVLDLNEFIVDIERLLQRTIGKDIDVKVIPLDRPANVFMDPGQVEQLLLNLGLNARDAMPDGGTLTVAATVERLTREDVAGSPEAEPGDYACLTVSDTGLGMNEDVKAHVFEPFFTTKSRGLGTGLGLASVYGIVQQAGGHVTIESESGKGTTFFVYLPATDEDPIGETAIDEPAHSQGAGEKIFLVEDEEPVRRLVTRILEGAGYEVVAVASGAEALDALDPEARIDLLLTDVLMPGMSGVELADRATTQQTGLRVLLMSGYAEDVVAPHVKTDRMYQLLAKPFDKKALLAEVRGCLEAPPPSVPEPEQAGEAVQ